MYKDRQLHHDVRRNYYSWDKRKKTDLSLIDKLITLVCFILVVSLMSV